jgi:hypothetical protein
MNIQRVKAEIKSIASIIPKKKLFKVSAVISLLMNISACSVYKSQFDCTPGKGVGCHSVSKVNDLINDDSLDDFIAGNLVTKTNSTVENAAPQSHSYQKAEKQNNGKTQKPEENQNKEKVSIFFAEYQDEKGVIHGAHEKQIFFGTASKAIKSGEIKQ